MSLQDKAREMYQTHTAKAIATELGVSESSVRRWVKGVEKERSKFPGNPPLPYCCTR